MATPEVTQRTIELGVAGLTANFGFPYARYNTRSSPTRASRIVMENVRFQEGWQFEDEYMHGIVLAGAGGLQRSSVTDDVATLVKYILEACAPLVALAQETDEYLFEETVEVLKETDLILADPETMEALAEADEDVAAGRVLTQEEAETFHLPTPAKSTKLGAKDFAAHINKSLTYVKEHAEELGGRKVNGKWQFEVRS